MNIFNIEAGLSFADTLAAGLLEGRVFAAGSKGDPASLSNIRILLPTRRACRVLRDAFLRLSGGSPLILPQLGTLGDVDEDELFLESFADADEAQAALSIPPAIDTLQRRLLLAQLVLAKEEHAGGGRDMAQAFALAGELARLLDQIHTENLSLADLPALVPDGPLAEHWKITLRFLEILSQAWPAILLERGVIDPGDRRNRLIMLRAQHWAQTPPQTPVVAAGSTGSLPATAELLRVIAGLPQGAVVLPGLDADMDDESWDAVAEGHPQATIKNLLSLLGAGRQQVKKWPQAGHIPTPVSAGRVRLAREIMRPSATAQHWRALSVLEASDPQHVLLQQGFEGLSVQECANQEEEAAFIAVMLRAALETPGKRAALVTPDRVLARRVAAFCRRWDFEADDSAGQALKDTKAGLFLRLSAQACAQQLRPSGLLSLLRHELCSIGRNHGFIDDHASIMEEFMLRGATPAPGMAGLRRRLLNNLQKIKEKKLYIEELLQLLERSIKSFLALCDGAPHPFAKLLDAHLEMSEALAAQDGRAGAEILWQGDEGAAASLFFADLRTNAVLIPSMNAADYAAVLDSLMSGVNIRSPYGTHPRVSILGQLEARLVQADLVILGGLNEGSWPALPSVDPWMSRPMRVQFGLPPAERGTGLAAHDFVQGFCAAEVVLTRARRAEGAPAVPARWLQRLSAVRKALGHGEAPSFGPAVSHIDFARAIDTNPAPPAPAARPAPRPPAHMRPQSLHVTAVETWMRDPYSLYAKYILGLRRLDELQAQADAARRGTVIHAALERFAASFPEGASLQGAEEVLRRFMHEELDKAFDNPGDAAFWRPRLDRMAEWFTAHEVQWRTTARPGAGEVKGQAQITHSRGVFTVKARADRIDMLRDGSGGAVIDYKTGTLPSGKSVAAGLSPQLPLEAVIMEDGGFEGLPALPPAYIGFWKPGGGPGGGKEKKAFSDKKTPADLARQARAGLAALAAAFADEDTPYYSLPMAKRAPPKERQDYAHLARVQEWAALDDAGTQEVD